MTRIYLTNEKHHNWKGDKVGYEAIHSWLLKYFGNPQVCEYCGEKGEKIKTLHGQHWNIQWAKIQGQEYERKKENFWGLCKKCHRNYDNKKNVKF